MTNSELARFIPKFKIMENGCWEWTAALLPKGYGAFKRRGRVWTAHRLAYEHWVRPILPRLVPDHLCENKRCVNPEHLEAVTIKENNRRFRQGHPEIVRDKLGRYFNLARAEKKE